tara:strand:- start:1031 stop:2284 length:1254 start_codon:yes stop_codon:yes gene_type:complete
MLKHIKMSNHKIINYCQISGSKKLNKIINLGFLPPVNEMFKIKKANINHNFFNTELYFSSKSNLVQINTIVDKKIIFPKSYPYTSSTTKILRDNFKNLRNEVDKLFSKINKKFILDIGSNDGNLLQNFKGKYKVLGVTPENIGKIAIKNGIPTILDYFNAKVCENIIKKHGKPNIVTATNVFAHIDKPLELLKNILSLLEKKNGIFISESHYLIPLLKDIQYDTVYHEHLRYYCLRSLNFLFKKFGLRIFKVQKINTHGGSIRVYATKSKMYRTENSVKKILQEEKKYLNKKFFLKFTKKVVQSKLDLYKLLSSLKKQNKIIYGVSAPSRATTLINFVGLDENIIDCVLEIDGSKKIGNYIPGTKIPIYSEKILRKKKPDYLIIFSWHIFKEIKKNLKKKGFKGKFIIPLPNPKILN